MLTVTADTNIYLSALIWGGKPLQLLESAIAGEIRLAISDAILNETLRVMRGKFRLSEERIAVAKQYIEGCTDRVVVTQVLNVISEDPSDDRILECAVSAGADVIVSGDKHLLRLKQFGRIRIVTLAEFLGG